MCTKNEMNQKVAEIRSLKALKEETEAAIRALETEVITFLNESEECEAVDKKGNQIRQYIGADYKATYSIQTRENVNKEAVKKLLSKEQFESVKTESTFGVLRIR